MTITQRDRIKTKIFNINHKRWWGDDFDIRFLLISKLKGIQNCSMLDLGGGVGIISSEIEKNNIRVNLDISFSDLKICQDKVDSKINLVCASMTNLPFKKKYFDYIICANLLEVTKKLDIENNNIENNNEIMSYPTANKLIKEIFENLNSKGKLYLTTPNNLYYNTSKLTYDELINIISSVFLNYKILFYNTHRKIGKQRKFNFANIVPKIHSKISNPDKIIKNLLKHKSKKNYSLSFLVEANIEEDI